ncbi:hypothetical protein [Pseudomonas sp. GV071]|uniref:hypothetical protein n=1 Tax=Pseudomonas sp. GV071 TaxID=2135754 RepID=UPI000D3B552E|nr:hypothetical protein [Pseudomonas sp. GV071]
MDLLIEEVSGPSQPKWLVHTCGLTFRFFDQRSAETFASTLQERVNAPHQLPEDAVKYWAREHWRILRGS